MNTDTPLLRVLPLVLAFVVTGCDRAGAAGRGDGDAADKQDTHMTSADNTVEVHVYNTDGKLVGPVASPRVEKPDEQWKQQLDANQYRILRNAGTEMSGTGALLDNKQEGVYTCAGCGLPLFASDAKFHSGTGWPSYFQAIGKGNVAERVDTSHGMRRVEILCARCDGHLGHVFEDGPKPTGLRYCVNSASLAFTPAGKLADLADPAADKPAMATAVLAGGCFWCTEAVFTPLKGVSSVVSGYAGGTKETADYQAVSAGTTSHAEAIRITYDPSVISYDALLKVFFTVAHDPTTLNRQGADVGTQYRSAVFYADEQEKQAAQHMIEKITAEKVYKDPIVTTLEPLTEFYPAEKYHQDYVANNPNQPYVRAVAMPKVRKLEKKFGDKLKTE